MSGALPMVLVRLRWVAERLTLGLKAPKAQSLSFFGLVRIRMDELRQEYPCISVISTNPELLDIPWKHFPLHLGGYLAADLAMALCGQADLKHSRQLRSLWGRVTRRVDPPLVCRTSAHSAILSPASR